MQTVSIHKKIGGESLAELLKNISSEPEPEPQGSQGETIEYGSPKKKLDLYLKGANFDREIFGDDMSIEIISNAMILERFKVEAIEMLGQNENLTDEQRKKILAEIFGEGSEYKKLYDKYYQPEGLVKSAQKLLKEKKIKPIFENVVPPGLSSASFDIAKDVFKNIKDLKKETNLQGNHDRSFVIATTAFDKEDLNFTIMGLLASDPRELGAMLAVMGNKDKEGEILMEKDKRFNIGMGSVKGVLSTAARCLIVLAICVAFLYLASTVATVGAAFAAGSFAVNSSTLLSATACLVVGLKGFDHVRTTVEKENYLTRDVTTSSVNTNAAGSGISTDDLYKFIVAPITKGSLKDKKSYSKSPFEQKLLRIQTAIGENKRLNNELNESEHEKMEEIIPKKKYLEALKSFGILVKGLEKSR